MAGIVFIASNLSVSSAERAINPNEVRVEIGDLTVYLSRDEAVHLAADLINAADSERVAVAA